MKSAIYLLLLLFSTLVSAQQPANEWSVFIEDSAAYQNGRPFSGQINNTPFLLHTSINPINSECFLNLSFLNTCGTLKDGYRYKLPFSNALTIINIAVDAQQNIYILSVPNSNVVANTFVITKINASGHLIWCNKYSNNTDCVFYAFSSDANGNLFLNFNSTTVNDPKNVVAKIKNNGSIDWINTYGIGSVYGWGGSTSDGGYLLAMGRSIRKLNASGNMEWVNTLSGDYVQLNPVEYKDGYLLMQLSSTNFKSRLVLLNKDGSIRWYSDKINNFLANDIRVINDEVYCSGISMNVLIQNLALLKLNSLQSPNVSTLEVAGVQNFFASQISGTGHDLLISASAQRINGNRGYLYSRFPADIDLSTCFLSQNVTNTENDTCFISPQNLITKSPYPFTNTSLTTQISVSSKNYQAINYVCQKANDQKEFSLGNDTTLCPGNSIQLSAPANGSYEWSTGEKTRSITVAEAGEYLVKAQFGCDTTTYSDTVIISFFPDYQIDLSISPDKKDFTLGDSILISAFSDVSNAFNWYVNGTLIKEYSPFLAYKFSQPKEYTFTAYLKTEPHQCSYSRQITLEVKAPELQFPNVFTPNGDGINDRFTSLQPFYKSYNIHIYNKYGALINSVNADGWDGTTSNGLPTAEGVYFYVISIVGEAEPLKGSVTLMR